MKIKVPMRMFVLVETKYRHPTYKTPKNETRKIAEISTHPYILVLVVALAWRMSPPSWTSSSRPTCRGRGIPPTSSVGCSTGAGPWHVNSR